MQIAPPAAEKSFYLDVIETTWVQSPEDQGEKLAKSLKRYEKAKKRTLALSEHLAMNGELRLSSRLRECGSWLTFRDYFTAGRLKLVKANFCKTHLLCVLCAIRRGAKLLSRYVERFERIKADRPALRAQLLTLTVKNGPVLAIVHSHLMKSFRKLRQKKRNAAKGRSKTEWTKVLGYVGAVEVTNKGNGWHPHLHLIVLSDDGIDQDSLSDEWRRITGDSHILDVRDLERHEDSLKDFSEVFKYSVDFGELSHEDQCVAYAIFKGARLIVSGGLFYGIGADPKLTDDPLADLPYIESIFRWMDGTYKPYKKTVMKGEKDERSKRE